MPAITGSLEDREQIRELYARYAITIDNGQFEDWVGCFTADGVFESPIYGTYSGAAALREFCTTYEKTWDGAQVRHMIVNVSVDIEGERASGTCNLIYYHIKGGKTELVAVGVYRDELSKIGGNWLFARRKIFIDR